jgi:hypothetical protein
MARNDLGLKRRKVVFDDVQVGAADAASDDSKQYVAGLQSRTGNLADLKIRSGRRGGGDENSGLHRSAATREP